MDTAQDAKTTAEEVLAAEEPLVRDDKRFCQSVCLSVRLTGLWVSDLSELAWHLKGFAYIACTPHGSMDDYELGQPMIETCRSRWVRWC